MSTHRLSMALQHPQEMPQLPANTPELKVVLLGDGGVEKLEFVRLLSKVGMVFHPTPGVLGVQVHVAVLYTNRGPIKINIWDTAGQEKFGGLRDGYYQNAQGAIIMFDLTHRSTYSGVRNWHRDLTRVNENLPVVLVGNNAHEQHRFPVHRIRLPFYAISTNEETGLDLPFLWLARQWAATNLVFFLEPSDYEKYLQIKQTKQSLSMLLGIPTQSEQEPDPEPQNLTEYRAQLAAADQHNSELITMAVAAGSSGFELQE